MSASPATCAAANLFGDRHRCTGRWYEVVDPDGWVFDLCSAACLVEYATLGALPAEARRRPAPRAVESNERS